MRQLPFRSLWAFGLIGERAHANRLHLNMTTPAEMVECLGILDPFQTSALASLRVGMRAIQ